MSPEPVVAALLASGWRRRPGVGSSIREALPARYRAVPDDVTEFLANAEGAIKDDETAWFLNGDDYAGRAPAAFRWNEWEALSLEAAEGDAAEVARITAFWDRHLPCLMSVGGEYAFWAAVVDGPQAGAVVFGCEPEFEEVEVVATSFSGFLTTVRDTLERRGVGSALARVLLPPEGD